MLTANVLLLWFKPGDWFWYLRSFDYNQIEKLEMIKKKKVGRELSTQMCKQIAEIAR